MRAAISAGLVVAGLAISCSSTPPALTPTLSVSPAGLVEVAGSQLFTATVTNSSDAVGWTLKAGDPGALSSASGPATTYVAPATTGPAGGTATLTATVAGLTQTVNIHFAPPSVGTATIPLLRAPVKVEYDVQGIPHIFCVAEVNDCLAVQGYLDAQERLFQMDFLRRTSRGQLATLLGPEGVSQDKQILTLFTTRTGQRLEQAVAAAADAVVTASVSAYVSGVNAYLAKVRANARLIPGEYARLPTPIVSGADIPDWTPADVFALTRLQQYNLSSTLDEESAYGQFAQAYGSGPLADPGKLRAWIRSKEPVHSFTLDPLARLEKPRPSRSALATATGSRVPGAGAMLAAVYQQAGALKGTLRSMGLGAGSNDWVVDAAHSASGHAMVANDPHLSILYPPLFHLFAMTAGDGSVLDVTGGGFAGLPGALVGRGAHVGWGVTVVLYDVLDLYLETLDASNATVAFKGGQVPLGGAAHTIKVRGGADVPFAVGVVPHHGPIIQLDPVRHTAISVRWTGHEATNDLKGFLGLNLATGVGNLGDDPVAGTTAFAALASYATGAQNFVLADDQGNIGFDPHALVPKRPWAGAPYGPIRLFPWLPLPGDGSAEWGSQDPADTCDTVPKAGCWVADADLPHGRNPTAGFFLTANSDPSGDTEDNDPIQNPPRTSPSYLSFDWDDPTGFRASRIGELLLQKTAGGRKVTLDDMAAIQGDHQVKVAKVLLPSLQAIPVGDQSNSFKAALALLAQWSQDDFDCPTGLAGISPSSPPDPDATHLRDANACLLFHTFLRTVLDSVFADDLGAAHVGRSEGPELRALLYMLEAGTPDVDRTFCKDVGATGVVTRARTCPQQLEAALASSFDALTAAYGASSKWLWGKVHTLTPVSLASPLVAAPYQAGPFARPGGVLTVDVGNPGRSSDPRAFAYGSGSQVRHLSVMDPANPITRMQLCGVNKDVPWGEVASGPADLLTPYIQNQYFTFAHGSQLNTQSGVVAVQSFTAQ